ncbi:hypothetical protein [uncultured Desulfovibrio sp.]|uniref:hypothetical protein n=1 Tax=uncultured Desulfovibrio sp. TaxID=167968 RepID=UPI002806333A|nr:hypothetical protein [uncultured Desulfovibrio sp.]
MNALEQILSAFPHLRTAVDVLSIVVPLSALFAFAGMGFISATARILADTRGRSSFEKCARQLAFLGMMLGWILLVGGRVWLHFTRDVYVPGSVSAYFLEMSWLLLSLGVMLNSVYYTLWRVLRELPILHATIGMISAAQSSFAVIVVLGTARLLAAFAHPQAAAPGLQNLLPDAWSSPLWTAMACTPFLLVAVPAAVGAFWLPLRRTRDDFGRDHYNTMIPWCAAWARNAWAMLWLALMAFTAVRISQTWGSGGFTVQEAILESTRLLLWLIPVLLWTLVRRSPVALRHKPTLAAALLIVMGFMLPYYLDLTAF